MVFEVPYYKITPTFLLLPCTRYIHCAVAPLLIFAIHKEMRKKSKDLLCCWRPNSVESSSPRPISAYLRRQRKELEKQKKKFKNITNYT